MNPTRWLLVALLAAGCSKDPSPNASGAVGGSSATGAAGAPSEAARVGGASGTPAEEPATPGSAHAQSTTDAHSEALPSERDVASASAAAGGSARAAAGDVVAVGGNREKVVATAGKTAAESESYRLSVAAPARVPKGAEGVITLDLQPKQGWHLNREFPTKLTVTAPPGVVIQKAEQGVADATRWTDAAGQFAIRFTAAAAGPTAFSGKLRFAVCTDTTCDPKKEELAWSVAVE